ncbi:MAG: hypothetical protein U1E17_16480 [Geminicoccaceae bacterium]
MLGENAAARIAQLLIFDAIVAVAQRDLKAAERNLAATRDAVSASGACSPQPPVVVVVGSLHYDIMVDAPTWSAAPGRDRHRPGLAP